MAVAYGPDRRIGAVRTLTVTAAALLVDPAGFAQMIGAVAREMVDGDGCTRMCCSER